MVAILVSDISQDIQNEIDALGLLEPEVKKAKALVKDYAERAAALVASLGDGDPELGKLVQAAVFQAELTPCAQKRSIKDLPRLINILGAQTFLQIADVKIGDVVKYVPEAQLDEVLETSRIGPRTVKLSKRGS
jgi:hypothetical protein